ncbi:hypothetical protein CVT26_001600 [Gymnopilus dilepis]|uniref:NACHT domain-containing protein n=1 Tax=Gymnopilus dilepis TaxID=231916 RepID=A0A409YXF4_9AGAR|nr:hypothetical protein CVT26_001600 [Gymnopilus dilepis]
MFNQSKNVVVNGGTFSTQINHYDEEPFDRLVGVVSHAAFHDSSASYDAPKCYPNTRLAVQENIRNWARGLDTETRTALIMWLHGPAGAGKSAIAQSIAKELTDEILASYFFSRTDPTPNHAASLIATIAYQISVHFPSVRDRIEDVIHTDPLILTRSLSTQMLHLVTKPLEGLLRAGYFSDPRSRRLIIIDGLDECNSGKGQTEILQTIADALHDSHLPLRFLIASRPEHDLTHAFSRRYLLEISTRLALDDTYMPKRQLNIYYLDPYLTSLVICCSEVHVNYTHGFTAALHCGLFKALLAGDTAHCDDWEGLRLRFLLRGYTDSTERARFAMARMLNDAVLLGGYAVNMERKLVAALYLLKMVKKIYGKFNAWKIPCLQLQLCRSPGPFVHNPRRIYRPWRWRKMPLALAPASRHQRCLIQKCQTFSQEWALSAEDGIDTAHRLQSAMQLLFRLLPALDHSQELIDFVRGPACRLMLRFFERRVSKELRNAVKKYLQDSDVSSR